VAVLVVQSADGAAATTLQRHLTTGLDTTTSTQAQSHEIVTIATTSRSSELRQQALSRTRRQRYTSNPCLTLLYEKGL